MHFMPLCIVEKVINSKMPAAIEVNNLRKVFGDKVAVADLTLTVERGEVFGFQDRGCKTTA
jgi:ABC-type uncharacterized transport system ATPase subunit